MIKFISLSSFLKNIDPFLQLISQEVFSYPVATLRHYGYRITIIWLNFYVI